MQFGKKENYKTKSKKKKYKKWKLETNDNLVKYVLKMKIVSINEN